MRRSAQLFHKVFIPTSNEGLQSPPLINSLMWIVGALCALLLPLTITVQGWFNDMVLGLVDVSSTPRTCSLGHVFLAQGLSYIPWILCKLIRSRQARQPRNPYLYLPYTPFFNFLRVFMAALFALVVPFTLLSTCSVLMPTNKEIKILEERTIIIDFDSGLNLRVTNILITMVVWFVGDVITGYGTPRFMPIALSSVVRTDVLRRVAPLLTSTLHESKNLSNQRKCTFMLSDRGTSVDSVDEEVTRSYGLNMGYASMGIGHHAFGMDFRSTGRSLPISLYWMIDWLSRLIQYGLLMWTVIHNPSNIRADSVVADSAVGVTVTLTAYVAMLLTCNTMNEYKPSGAAFWLDADLIICLTSMGGFFASCWHSKPFSEDMCYFVTFYFIFFSLIRVLYHKVPFIDAEGLSNTGMVFQHRHWIDLFQGISVIPLMHKLDTQPSIVRWSLQLLCVFNSLRLLYLASGRPRKLL